MNDAGIEHVYLSGLGNEDDDRSKHLQSRREVEKILSEGDFELTILRAAIIIGEENESFAIVAQLARRLPVMVTPRWVRNDCRPIAIEDVIAYLVGVIEIPEAAGNTYEIGGSSVITYEQFIKHTTEIEGRSTFITSVPVYPPTFDILGRASN